MRGGGEKREVGGGEEGRGKELGVKGGKGGGTEERKQGAII